MSAFYSENDPYAAQFLRNLIKAGHIADGEVDERSITEIEPADLRGFTQCHFFAGIGIWSHALRQAGWPDDRPVWTGSCPCQPFSAAGKGAGFEDERHLWPSWFRLIRECRPEFVLGEQVASKDALTWFDHVSTDMEAEGYTIGSVDSCAAGYGCPGIRQRLYFVANTHAGRPQHEVQAGRRSVGVSGEASGTGSMDNPTSTRQQSEGQGSEDQARHEARMRGPERGCAVDELGNPIDPRLERHSRDEQDRNEPGRQREDQAGSAAEAGASSGTVADSEKQRQCTNELGRDSENGEQLVRPGQGSNSCDNGPTNGFWSDAEWLPCTDGKARPVEPGTFPLADGVANRVGRLRAYGNALCAPQAAAFVTAFIETTQEIIE